MKLEMSPIVHVCLVCLGFNDVSSLGGLKYIDKQTDENLHVGVASAITVVTKTLVS